MKKILFAAYSLGIGGIETSLVTLLNSLSEKYEITLVLEKKEGIFLNKISPKINIIKYQPSNTKIVLIRKAINMIKQLKFKLKYKYKFDFAAAYATYSLSNGFVARTASKNSALWIHNDYMSLNNNSQEKTKKYYQELKIEQYKNVIFVSNKSKNEYLKMFPNTTNAVFCNNLIDGENILNKAKDEILKEDLIKINKKNETIFLNVGRHDEKQKRLTKMINVAKRLKDDNFKFKILFVGDGQDTEKYKKIVKEKNLEDVIIFLGKKQNPYPYYKISDCVFLTSDYEGFPVVFLESMILKKPIITTDVSDYEEIEGKFGIVTTKDENDIYKKVKDYLENGFEIKEKFNYEKYNAQVLSVIEHIINT